MRRALQRVRRKGKYLGGRFDCGSFPQWGRHRENVINPNNSLCYFSSVTTATFRRTNAIPSAVVATKKLFF